MSKLTPEQREIRRATQAEMDRRTHDVYLLILNGATRAQIHKHASTAWACATRQVDAIIQRARKVLATETAAEREERLTLARARLNNLYARAMAQNAYKTALAVLREINQLESLYAPPAINTLKLELEGTDPQLLIEVLRACSKYDIPPSELFNDLLTEIHAAKQEAQDGQ